MKRLLVQLFIIFICIPNIWAQTTENIELEKVYKNLTLDGSTSQNFSMKWKKDELYKITVVQQGVDVIVYLKNSKGAILHEQDSPNGNEGLETFEFESTTNGQISIEVKQLEEGEGDLQGSFSLKVHHITKEERKEKERIKKELEPENKKNVLTVDIDHFWEAFDLLSTAKNHKDSVNIIQKTYIDRATDGLIDFINVRNFTAEKYVNTINEFPKFYNSIRENTLEAKKSVPIIEEVFTEFKEVYPDFEPFKVCFAIGIINTGGTVSDKFVLIGTEVTTSTNSTDLSEFNNSPYSKQLANGTNEELIQEIKNMIAHECVHTQQEMSLEEDAVMCMQLHYCLYEGSCDFIGELLAKGQINNVAKTYGDKNEEALWQEFKASLCTNNANNWLYNYSTVKDKPADLGYYIGYKIVQSYYENAEDKKQALRDILHINNPLQFLEKSKYDKKPKGGQ
jgi:hypothetical protein